MSDVEVEVEELFALFGVAVLVIIFSPFGDAWLFWAAHNNRRDSDETATRQADETAAEKGDRRLQTRMTMVMVMALLLQSVY